MTKMRNTRELVFDDRADLDELLQEHPLWENLYENLYLILKDKLRRTHLFCEPSALDILNDVYYNCIKVIIDRHPEDEFCSKFLQPDYGDNFVGYTEDSALTLSLSYAVLALSNHKNKKNVRHFLDCTKKFFKDKHYLFGSVLEFVENNTINYDFTIKITPLHPDKLSHVYGSDLHDFWLRIIRECKISDILRLYDTRQNKIKILEQIIEASRHDPCDEHTCDLLQKLKAEINGNLDESKTNKLQKTFPTAIEAIDEGQAGKTACNDANIQHVTHKETEKNTTTTTPSTTPENHTCAKQNTPTPNTDATQAQVDTVFKVNFSPYIREKLWEVMQQFCKAKCNYGMLEKALYDYGYINAENSHKAFLEVLHEIYNNLPYDPKVANLRSAYKDSETKSMVKKLEEAKSIMTRVGLADTKSSR